MSKREHSKAEKAAFDYQKAQLAILNIEGEKKAAYAEIDAKYAKDLEAAKATALDAETTLEEYTRKYRDELFNGKDKTVKFGPISLSLKMRPPSIGFLDGCKPDDVLSKIEKYLPDYLRIKKEIDKRKLLSDQETIGKDMKKCGLQIVQEEKFEVSL